MTPQKIYVAGHPGMVGSAICMVDLSKVKIGIIGLGYVGLPLAVEFGKHFDTVGFDINVRRIAELESGLDVTLEEDANELSHAKKLTYTSDIKGLSGCNVFIITVPTPVDDDKRADFSPLIRASQDVGRVLKKGDLVIYESTVYPGATEEICVPQLEDHSNLRFNDDFTVGYSPERINPGDKKHRLTNIIKVTAGSTPDAADFVDALYRSIVTVGTHKVSSIKVAEAAKIIENTQRDANIALMNEFALIFNRLGIDTNEVLQAAGTKWNFLPFTPGLVGGHCIGVDPYYLIQKAQSVGYNPDILLACRRINDAIGKHIAFEVVKLMIHKGHAIAGSRILVLGLTFKENCRDLRNTRVIEIVRELESFTARVDIYDPWANSLEAKLMYNIDLLPEMPTQGSYDALVVAVSHDQFKVVKIEELHHITNDSAVIYDIKGILPKNEVDGRL